MGASLNCFPSSARSTSGDYLVSGHRLGKSLAKTLTNCLTKYVPSSDDPTISTETLSVRFISIMSQHALVSKIHGMGLVDSNLSCAIVRIQAFFSSDTNDFDMERYQQLNVEYWQRCVGGIKCLLAEEHFDRTTAIAERFMVAKLPARLFIEQEPCRFRHIKSMSGVLSEAFLLLNRGCALIMINGMGASNKKVIYPELQSACLLLTWEQSQQDGCEDRAQLLDLEHELLWLRGEYDDAETYPAFQNRFVHDVADYAGFLVRKANMTQEEIRLFIIHDQPEYTSLSGLAQKPILGIQVSG